MMNSEIEQDRRLKMEKAATFKLNKEGAITLAAFLGTPIASGILMRMNYMAMGEPGKGNKALLYSVLGTILMLGLIYGLPEDIIDAVPNQLMPLIYTAIVYYFTYKKLSPAISDHKTYGGEFYSYGRAVWIGLACFLAIFAIIFAAIFAF